MVVDVVATTICRLPGKLLDCSTQSAEGTEIFITHKGRRIAQVRRFFTSNPKLPTPSRRVLRSSTLPMTRPVSMVDTHSLGPLTPMHV